MLVCSVEAAASPTHGLVAVNLAALEDRTISDSARPRGLETGRKCNKYTTGRSGKVEWRT